MGIDTSWKNVLKEQFGWPGMTEYAAQNITVVIDDITLNMRSLLKGISTWEELGDRLRGRVRTHVRMGKLKEYWVLWDETKHVPPNKAVTQKKRADSVRVQPFSEDEQSRIVIGETPIPDMAAEFFNRLMATRSMHQGLYEFAAAELAFADLDPGMRLILDGARARGIWNKKLSGAPVSVLAYSPVTVGDTEPDDEQLDTPKRLYVNRVSDDVVVEVVDSRCIGESDFKIPAVIADLDAGELVFIRSCDTDLLVILLLHMRNYICTESTGELGVPHGMIKYGLYLDTEGPGRKAGSEPVPKLDMGGLWRNIVDKLTSRFDGITEPIETLAILMLLSGSDYADRFPMVGARTVWKTFEDIVGRRVLLPRTPASGKLVHMDDVRGEPYTHVHIGFDEQRIWKFVAFIYHRLVLKHAPFPEQSAYSLDKARGSRALDVEAVRRSGRNLTSRNSWMPPSDAEISAGVRRLSWNLHYVMNGSKNHKPWNDPFMLDSDTGTSLFGWVSTGEGMACDLTDQVYNAARE